MDIYDKEVERITDKCKWLSKKSQNEILQEEWNQWTLLFGPCGRSKLIIKNNHFIAEVGCLTMVKSGTHDAQTKELTEKIRSDDRIPKKPSQLTVEHLPVFAEYRRYINNVLGI